MEEEICLYPTNLYKYLLDAGIARQIDKTENNKQTECYRSVGDGQLIFGQTFLNRGESEFMGESSGASSKEAIRRAWSQLRSVARQSRPG